MRVTVCLALAAAAFASGRPAAAQSNDALGFDGQDDCVMVPYDASFPTETFSAGAWIKLPQPTMGNSAIIGRGEDDDSFNFAWQLYLNPQGRLQPTLENENETNFCYPLSCVGGGQVPTCTAGDMFVADDQWHHVAATRNSAGDLSLYIDGVEVASCGGTGTPSSQNSQFLTIGCTHFFVGPPPGGEEPTAWFFGGLIDEPAIWNIALTGSQVLDVFLKGVDPGAAGLVGYWSFDEGSGQNVSDASPFANHGFLGEAQNEDSADPSWVIKDRGCQEDVNGDGAVNVLDLIELLLCFGQPPVGACALADINADGAVNVLDLVDLLLVFGASCP